MEMKNNTTSINALNNLDKAQNELSDSLRRLSSGQKINTAADAPVGLIISEGLRAQIASVHQALQDTEFSLSLVQTAEGALVEVNNLLLEMRQLALTAANEGANDYGTMLAIQYQIRNAVDSIDRISRFTNFGRKKLLDGSHGVTGLGDNEELIFLRASSKTLASPVSGYEVDIDELPLRATLSEDLDDDDASGLSIVLEEEDGPVIRVTNPEGATALGFANRLKDAVLGANINLDIQYDADDEELTIQHREYGVTKGFWITSSKDGVLTDDELEPELFHGQDIKGTIEDEPAEGDGLVLTGNFNNKKTSGLSVAYLGDSTGNAGSVTVAQNSLKFQTGPTGDEKIMVALNSTHSTSLGQGVDNRSGFKNLSDISLTSAQEAIDAISLVDHATDQLTLLRAQLGSAQKYTLETNISVLRNTAESLTAADSSIRDTDLAKEIVNFTKSQILTETAAAAVAQANQSAVRVLRLLFHHHVHDHWSFYAGH